MADFKMPGEHVYKGVRMPGAFPADVLDRIPDFEFRPDDVLIATYPKSGTTWLQQITWLIMHDADVETSRKVPLTNRSPFLEFGRGISRIDTLAGEKSPRLIKTHLPYGFFKQSIEGVGKPMFKTIVGMRNIRDVLVSFYHFYRMNAVLGNFDRDFEEFFQLFKKKELSTGDYFDHILSWWEAKSNPNIYFVKYEDMKKDPSEEILKIASFLGKTLNDAQLDAILQESSFKSMQKNPATNHESNGGVFDMNISKFIRKGEIGDWQNYFTQEQLEYVNNRCEKELLPHGLEFQYS